MQECKIFTVSMKFQNGFQKIHVYFHKTKYAKHDAGQSCQFSERDNSVDFQNGRQ